MNNPEFINLESELNVIFQAIEKFTTPGSEFIDQNFSIIAREFKQESPDRNLIGQATNNVIEKAKKSDGFSDFIDSHKEHIEKVVSWLGKDWKHIINLLNSVELGRKYPVEIVQYDIKWVEYYRKEIEFFNSRFDTNVVSRFEHFGSTAIPGIAAKPVIDILVEVSSFEEAEPTNGNGSLFKYFNLA